MYEGGVSMFKCLQENQLYNTNLVTENVEPACARYW